MRYIGLAFLLIILGYIGILNPIRDAYVDLVSPIQFGLRRGALTLKDAVDFFSKVGSVREQNLSLSQQVLDLESIILDLKKVQDENTVLREQLEIDNKTLLERDLILAGVMGNPLDTTGATLFLNKGTKDGVQIGDNVIKGNYLVGIIRSVTNERSLVELIISPNVSATAYDIDVPRKTEGLATGQYGSFVQFARVLPNEDLNVGDSIVTSGKDGFFYPGLHLGKVSNISQDPAQPLKTATLEVLVDLSKLEKVFILRMQ